MKVWEVTPHPGTTQYDYYVEQDRGRMLDYVTNHLFDVLERHDEEEFAKGVVLSLTFRQVEMSEEAYKEITGD